MFLRLFLAEQQDIGQKVGTEQRAQPFPENHSRGKEPYHDQQHYKIDDSHQCGAEQKTDADKQSVFEHRADRIVKSGQKREDIHQDYAVSSRSHEKYCRAKRPERVFKPHMIQDIPVDAQHDPYAKQDQPDDRSLLKIFPERMEKRFRQVPLFIFRDF